MTEPAAPTTPPAPSLAEPTIAIDLQNGVTLPTGLIDVLQAQLDDDLGPSPWHRTAELYDPTAPTPPPGSWRLTLTTDDPAAPQGVLGYHADDPDGIPHAYVFVARCQQAEVPESIVASHELLEMAVNPYLAQVALGKLEVPEEVGDTVEATQYAYTKTVNGVTFQVSDFLYPAAFEPGAPGPYDYAGHITSQSQLNLVQTGPAQSEAPGELTTSADVAAPPPPPPDPTPPTDPTPTPITPIQPAPVSCGPVGEGVAQYIEDRSWACLNPNASLYAVGVDGSNVEINYASDTSGGIHGVYATDAGGSWSVVDF